MLKQSYAVFAAVGLAAVMWIWVQQIAIPHQVAEASALETPRGNLSDLYPRWLGARELLLHGRDPYGADITREIQTGYYGRPIDLSRPHDPKDEQAFAYPLYVVFLLAPTVLLPFAVAQKIFLVVLIVLTATSVQLWLSAVGWRLSWMQKLVWIILALASFPAIQGFKLQQLTLLVAALLAAAVCAITRRYFVSAGVLLALATIKPQLVFLMAIWLGLWVMVNWRARQRLLWSFAVTFTLLVGGAELLLPGWIGKFRAASAAYYRYTGGGRSVLDVALTPYVGRVLATVLVVVVLILLWKLRKAGERSPEFQFSLAVVMATTLTVIPMFAPYNQLLLLPAVMLIVRYRRVLWTQSRMSRLLLVLALVALSWPWLTAGILSFARLILPARTVEQAWAVPLYTSLAIPVTMLAVLLAKGGPFCNESVPSS